MREVPYFNRFVVFDHLEKTAGTAVSRWLMNLLGERVVSRPHRFGEHSSILEQSGHNRIVIGHLSFVEGETLDPRYEYMTVLRDPVDRVISWLYFHINDVPDVPIVYHRRRGAERFLATDGKEIDNDVFLSAIRNYYVQHFSPIKCSNLYSGSDSLARACEAISQYRYIGLHEDLRGFCALLAQDLLNLETFPALPTVHKTSARLGVREISANLAARIAELNQEDIAFYEYVKKLVARREHLRNRRTSTPRVHYRWRKDDRALFNSCNPGNVEVHGVRVIQLDGDTLITGCWARLELDFSVREPVKEVLIGMHIHDASGLWIFGTNNLLLGQPASLPFAGRHTYAFAVQLNIAAGNYAIGFSLYDQAEQPHRLLAWWDESVRINVGLHPSQGFAGIAFLPARQDRGVEIVTTVIGDSKR